jgi:predicted nucleotidyltransferase
MIKSSLAALAAAFALSAPAAHAAAAVDQPAPEFTLQDTSGKSVSLADFKGRTVVLEWVNPGCPYVVKHYGSGNMQATQKAARDKGVVWLAVNTTSADHRDYLAPAAMAGWMAQQKAAASTTLMDSDGRVGRAYGARTTPHLYIVDGKGTLVYAGGIDNKPSANPADIPGAKNHVNAALATQYAGVGRPYHFQPTHSTRISRRIPMSTLEKIVARRDEILAVMSTHGASNPRLFGSVARGEDRPESDIDLLVDMESGRTLIDLIGLQQDLESRLGRRVDLLTPPALNRHMRDRILAEARTL